MRKLVIVLGMALAAVVLVGLAGGNGAQANAPEKYPEGFKCYVAQATDRFSSFELLLTDDFDEFQSTTVRAPVAYCNAANKTNGPNDSFDISPQDHLMCYAIRNASGKDPFARRTIEVEDQFGGQELTLTKPSRMCVFSIKVPQQDIDLVNQDVYKCYTVRRGEPVPRSGLGHVTLDDLWFDSGLKEITIGKPILFCDPAVKGKSFDGEDLPDLTCYQINKPSFNRFKIDTKDQFGVRLITIRKVETFCAFSGDVCDRIGQGEVAISQPCCFSGGGAAEPAGDTCPE